MIVMWKTECLRHWPEMQQKHRIETYYSINCVPRKLFGEGVFVEQQSCEQLSLADAGPVPSASAAVLPTKNDKSAKHPTLHVVEDAEVTGTTQDRVTGVEYQNDEKVKASVERLAHRYGYRFAKRTFDIAFSLLVLALFWWIYVIVVIAIKIDDPAGPVFFEREAL